MTAPGFHVQRQITETSAGRIVGELVTSDLWLEKIYDALRWQDPQTDWAEMALLYDMRHHWSAVYGLDYWTFTILSSGGMRR